MPASSLAVLRQETVARLAQVRAFKHVYDARQPQLRRDFLPAVRVYTSSSSQNLSISQVEFRTSTSLVVQIVCEDITDRRTAERADELAELAKWRLMGDGSWLLLFERVLSLTTDVDRNVEGEWRSTVVTLTFDLQCTESYTIFPSLTDMGLPPGVPGLPGVTTWEELPSLDEIRILSDVIDPAADPNTGPPGVAPNVQPQPPGYPGGHPGPDGRIEVDARFLTPTPKEP